MTSEDSNLIPQNESATSALEALIKKQSQFPTDLTSSLSMHCIFASFGRSNNNNNYFFLKKNLLITFSFNLVGCMIEI
jgi:hypothetical protein